MEFKNTGTITKIIYYLNNDTKNNDAAGNNATIKIMIKLDNHNDEEKINVIFLNESLPKLNNYDFVERKIFYARYDLDYDIGLLQLDLNKHYEFEFILGTPSEESNIKLLKITKITECNHE